MSEMVERVRVGVAKAQGCGWKLLCGIEPERPCACRNSARAAIEAMREPTQEMIDAVSPECIGDWPIAIDAALKEPAKAD